MLEVFKVSHFFVLINVMAFHIKFRSNLIDELHYNVIIPPILSVRKHNVCAWKIVVREGLKIVNLFHSCIESSIEVFLYCRGVLSFQVW